MSNYAEQLVAALSDIEDMVGDLMITCLRCKGSGVGSTGPDPDWCGDCGGPGQVFDQDRYEQLRTEAINKILREARRDQRHACAEAVMTMEGDKNNRWMVDKDQAHTAVMNAEPKQES